MKSIQDILDNYKEYEVFGDDRFGVRLCQFLTEEQMEKIGFSIKEEFKDKHEPKEWTRENIISQLKEDVGFGFQKALDKRGISASMMFEVVKGWNKVLEEGLESWDDNNYAQYGLPLFKATALKYDFPNPIGDDEGNEYIYSSEADEY